MADTTEWPEFKYGAGPTARVLQKPLLYTNNPFIATVDGGSCLQVPKEQYEKHWEPLVHRLFSQGFVLGYSNIKKDAGTLEMITATLASFNLLPMPVETSPLVVVASYPKKCPASGSAYETLNELYMLRYAVTRFLYDKKKDKKIIDQVMLLDQLLEVEIRDSGVTLDGTLTRHVYHPSHPEAVPRIDRREAATRFARIMEMYTMWMINRMEVFIFEALALGFTPKNAAEQLSIPETAAMTPHSEASGLLLLKTDPTGKWWNRCNAVARFMFNMRTHCYNAMMVQIYAQRGKGEVHTPVDPWCVSDYEEKTYAAFFEEAQKRRQGVTEPSPVLYKQWILYSVLAAYMDFINIT